MKPGKSMANMVSRLQTPKLELKQPKPASVFKFLNAIRFKSLADIVKDILRVKEMNPKSWTVQDVGPYCHQVREGARRENLMDNHKTGCGSF
jgi:hypothetical protein